MFTVMFFPLLQEFLRTNRRKASYDQQFAVQVWAPCWQAANSCLNFTLGKVLDASTVHIQLVDMANDIEYDWQNNKWPWEE